MFIGPQVGMVQPVSVQVVRRGYVQTCLEQRFLVSTIDVGTASTTVPETCAASLVHVGTVPFRACSGTNGRGKQTDTVGQSARLPLACFLLFLDLTV